MGLAGREVSVKSYSIRELIAHADSATFVIPPFQRDVVWEQERMAGLWDSMYRFYPIGTMLYWKTTDQLDLIRAVGGVPLRPEQLAAPRDAFRYILDGQQRLTAIYAGMRGGTNRIEGKESVNYSLYFDATANLAAAKTDDLIGDDALDLESDVFTGSEDKPAKSPYFLFEAELRARRKKLTLAGLPENLIVRVSDPAATSATRLEALTAQPNVPRAAISRLAQLRHMLDAYRIPVTRVSGVDIADVCGIYMRINRFGRRLDPADVVIGAVFSVGKAGAKGFNLRLRFNEIREELAALNPRWRRIESFRLFQMIAMCVRESHQRANNPDYKRYSVDASRLLRLTPGILQPMWPDIHSALVRTLKFLISLGIYEPERIPSAYLSMPICAYLFRRPDPDERQARFIRQWFWRAAFHDQGLDAPNDIFRAREVFFARLAAGETPHLKQLNLRAQDLLSNQVITSVFSKAYLAFLSQRGPRDFKSGEFVTFNPEQPEEYVVSDPTLHHICPKKLLSNLRREAKGRRAWSLESFSENALLNLCIQPGATNREMGHKSPADYFGEYESLPDFDAVLESHLIPPEFARQRTFDLDSYPGFLEARLALFKDALARALPDVEVRWQEPVVG
ncbi:MAG TPA: DUF262 domain-containing protein [Ktedonobacterales bacterium]